MRRLIIGSGLALCLASAGCNLFVTGVNNLCYETRLNVAEQYDDCRYVALAEEAWASARGKCGANGDSPDYAHGFKDGFADYMKFGGNGEPPALPPKHYQGLHFQSPKGYKRIEGWYAGFRDGAAAAKASGLRQFEMLPIKGLVGGPGHAPAAPGLGAPMLLPPVPSGSTFQPDIGPAPEIAPYPTPLEPPLTPRPEELKQPQPLPAPTPPAPAPPPAPLPAPTPPAPMPAPEARGLRFNLLPPVPPEPPPALPASRPTPVPAPVAPPALAPMLPAPPSVPMTQRLAPPRVVDENVRPAAATEAAPPPPRRPVEKIAPPRIVDGNATPASSVEIIEGPGSPGDPPLPPGVATPPRFGVPGSSPPVRIIEGDGTGSQP